MLSSVESNKDHYSEMNATSQHLAYPTRFHAKVLTVGCVHVTVLGAARRNLKTFKGGGDFKNLEEGLEVIPPLLHVDDFFCF